MKPGKGGGFGERTKIEGKDFKRQNDLLLGKAASRAGH